MAQSDFSAKQQCPAHTVGVLGQSAFMGVARVHIGTGGLPVPTRNFASGVATGLRTVYGVDPLGCTLVGTGLYEFTHAPVNIMSAWPQYVGPSGHGGELVPQSSPGNSASGVLRIQAFTAGVNTGMAAPTGALRIPFNPPSGTRFDVFLFANPQNDQAYTQY